MCTHITISCHPKEGCETLLCRCLLLSIAQWSNMHVTVRGHQYKMMRMHFMPRCSPGGGSP